jgi:hypothetical protein
MKWPQLLEIVGEEPIFSSSLLLSGSVSPAAVRRQLSRWTKDGRIVQIRRGLYAIGGPYRKVQAHPFLVANRLLRPSYVSLQSALAHHGMIPEAVPVVTSVTTRRPGLLTTPLGDHLFRHEKAELFFGFEAIDLGRGQSAFVAVPEKALLDLVHLTAEADRGGYLEELRLQNLEKLDPERLLAAARGSPKLRRAARRILDLRESEAREETP